MVRVELKFVLSALCALFVLCGNAQTKEQREKRAKYPVNFEVRHFNSSGNKENNYKTWWGSYDKTQSIQRSYKAQLKSRLAEPEDFSIEAIYIVVENKRTFPYSKEEIAFTLQPGVTTNIVFSSPEVKNTDVNYELAGYRRKSGSVLNGVIARLKKDGVIIDTWMSNRSYSKWAWQPEVEVKVEKDDDTSAFGSYEDRERATEVRLSSQERQPATPPQTDVAPEFFKSQRSVEPARFKAQMRLGSYFFNDFRVFRNTHYCMEVFAIDSSGRRTMLYGYARKTSPLGERLAKDFKQGGEHDVTVVLRYPRNAKDADGCFLDDYSRDE